MIKYFYTALTRISNLREVRFEVEPLPRENWAAGDYVVGEVHERASPVVRVELSTGRTIEALEGSHIIGAFGDRRATLEAVGSWRAIEDDHHMHVIGGGGLMGKLTSQSPYLAQMLSVVYEGHVLVDGRKQTMRDFSLVAEPRPFLLPTVLVIGTSMDAGKTTAARMLIRELKEMGQRVIGAKITGSGRYRDILSMRDAGADHILDFCDVGLPTTVCPANEYETALRTLLSHMAGLDAHVAVFEVGASPLEPYNGDTAVRVIGDNVNFTVLCASDPYAVVGIVEAYGRAPDVVAGAAANTQAGIDLVEKLTGIRTVNLLDRGSMWLVRDLLRSAINADRTIAGPAA